MVRAWDISLNFLQGGVSFPIVFCGPEEGIVRIEDQDRRVLYENSAVQEAYTRRQNTELQRDELREKGVFYRP